MGISEPLDAFTRQRELYIKQRRQDRKSNRYDGSKLHLSASQQHTYLQIYKGMQRIKRDTKDTKDKKGYKGIQRDTKG